MNERAKLREARLADAPELAALCTELGYPSSVAQAEARLPFLLSSADHLVLVATDAGDRAIAWLHAVVRRQPASDAFVQIAGLVVADGHRNAGLGALLLARAEAWALEAGVQSVHVRSNVTRQRAHGFYLRAGYALAKTSHLFTRILGPDAGRVL